MALDAGRLLAVPALLLGLAVFSGDAAAGGPRDFAKPSKFTRHALIVPTHFPTIQSAIDAAAPGRIIRVLPGTYSEQIVIRKDVTVVGSGIDRTIIRSVTTRSAATTAPPICRTTAGRTSSRSSSMPG